MLVHQDPSGLTPCGLLGAWKALALVLILMQVLPLRGVVKNIIFVTLVLKNISHVADHLDCFIDRSAVESVNFLTNNSCHGFCKKFGPTCVADAANRDK